MPSDVTLKNIGVWFSVGFVLGLSWYLGTWIASSFVVRWF